MREPSELRKRVLARRLARPEDAAGRTVAGVECGGAAFGVGFTDGTWVYGEAVGDCDDVDFDFAYPDPGAHELFGMGVVTEEEFATLRAEEKEAEAERKRRQYERLRAEFGRPGDAAGGAGEGR